MTAGQYRFDALVVDEGQDLAAEWWQVLRTLLVENADVLWLEDDEQDLFGQPSVALDGFVSYESRDNWRTPQSVARLIEQWFPGRAVYRNPLPGLPCEVIQCQEEQEQPARLEECIRSMVQQGFEAEDIAVLTVRSMRDSFLHSVESIAGLPVRRFSGDYDDKGRQVLSDGKLLVESIYRFKGNQAPAVVLVDCSSRCTTSTDDVHAFYCGLTRCALSLQILWQGSGRWSS